MKSHQQYRRRASRWQAFTGLVISFGITLCCGLTLLGAWAAGPAVQEYLRCTMGEDRTGCDG